MIICIHQAQAHKPKPTNKPHLHQAQSIRYQWASPRQLTVGMKRPK